LDEIQIKVLGFSLIAIHSHLCSFVKEKGGKPDKKPFPLPYGLRNPYRNLKSENSQDYAQKPQRHCTFMNSASGKQYTANLGLISIKYKNLY
jgi:hypothetical protein